MGRAGLLETTARLEREGGDVGRLFGQLGVRTGTQFWRLLRRRAVEAVRRATASATSSSRRSPPGPAAAISDSRDLYPFDPGIETIDDFYGTSLALRQTWQTKRGGPGQWREVDWITFDVELNLFGDEPKYEPAHRALSTTTGRRTASPATTCGPTSSTASATRRAILAESNFDLNDGSMDLFDISYAVERTPRFSYFLGYRLIADTDSNLIGGGVNYELNEKYQWPVALLRPGP